MKQHYLLDSSFVIDLINELADGTPGPAYRWMDKHRQSTFWISAVTYAEVLEGADDEEAVRSYLSNFKWQGIHRIQAENVAALQRRTGQRMGENDAWQAAIVLHLKGKLVGHDPKAFARLGDVYVDHRKE